MLLGTIFDLAEYKVDEASLSGTLNILGGRSLQNIKDTVLLAILKIIFS